jgi:hypothetical protein
MRPDVGSASWRTRRPFAWLCLTQAAPILVIGFLAAILLARVL